MKLPITVINTCDDCLLQQEIFTQNLDALDHKLYDAVV